MSNSGIRFEQQLAKDLRGLGYDVVRGAASKGKLAGMDIDLVVSKLTPKNKFEAGVALFQLKRSKR